MLTNSDIPAVSREEIIKYILSQPDEKRIAFAESQCKSKIGCLMIQYIRESHQDIEFDGCGGTRWIDKDYNPVMRASGWRFSSWGINHANYGTLKAMVRLEEYAL